MIELAPYVPIFIQLVILAGTIYVARSARPKLVAETKQVEGEAAPTPGDGARIARVSGGTGRGYRKQHRRWTRSDFCRRDEPAGGEERAERAVGGVSADDLPARWRADCGGGRDR